MIGVAAREYLDTVWSSSRGFFENLVPILSYLPLLGPIKIIPFLLTAFGAHMLNLSPARLGKWMDEKAGTGPGESPSVEGIASKLEDAFSSVMQEKQAEAMSCRGLTKEANIFSALSRSMNLPKAIAKGVGTLIKWILGLYGVATIDQFLRKVGTGVGAATGIAEVPEKIKDTVERVIEREELPATPAPESSNNKIDSMIDTLQEKYKLQ